MLEIQIASDDYNLLDEISPIGCQVVLTYTYLESLQGVLSKHYSDELLGIASLIKQPEVITVWSKEDCLIKHYRKHNGIYLVLTLKLIMMVWLVVAIEEVSDIPREEERIYIAVK